jgi:hypothetical protein
MASQVGPLKKVLATICSHCPLCNHGRSRPDSFIGRLLHHPIHADHCPFWKAEHDLRTERAGDAG